MGLNLGRLLRSSAQPLGELRERRAAKAEVERKRTLEDAIAKQREEDRAYELSRRPMLDDLLRAQVGEMNRRNTPETRPEPLERVVEGEKVVYAPRSQAVGKEAPRPAAAPEPLVQIEGPTGDAIYARRSKAEGQRAPIPSGVGSAAINKSVAANKVQLQAIDDALSSLDANPDAVGLKRGVGEIIPLMGGVQDAINQRADPGGVRTRALISNIGSLKLHDRSGAAVSIHEFPRLKPFIPGVGDTPDAIRQKLVELRKGIELELRELERSPAPKAGGSDDFSDEEVLQAYQSGARSDAEIAAAIQKARGLR